MLSILCVSLFISILHGLPTSNRPSSSPLLLLISLDGFRWDYPDIYPLPHFNSLLKRGVRVKHIDNSFATVTFPSHFTMVTGLYEETHGIVANTIYDPILKDVTTISTMNDTKWWSQNPYSQPIWVSNQLANDSFQRRSGAIAWPGSSTPINGHLPTKYQEFDFGRSFLSSIKQVFDWFHEPIETGINFGVIYHYQPDTIGHIFGPISSETNKTLKECDDSLGALLAIVDNDEFFKNNLNVIITSDHGMHDVDRIHRIRLEDFINRSLFSAYGAHSFANIFVKKESDIDRLYANLSVIPNYEVYKKSQIPDEYHYKSNVRIGDILIIGKIGYQMILPGDDLKSQRLGDHGYDNRAESMHPIFYGFGPAFRSNLLAEPFRSVDLYPLMAYILRLKQRQTNGSLDNVKHILTDFEQSKLSNLPVAMCIVVVIAMTIVYSIWAWRHSRELIYVQPTITSMQYRLLRNDEGSTNNLVISESDEEEIEQRI